MPRVRARAEFRDDYADTGDLVLHLGRWLCVTSPPIVIVAVWQNLWGKMAHFSSRQASPLRVATGGDASWRLEARRRRSPACC